MAFKLFDWIKDTTVSTGTDDFALAGAFATFRSFDDVLLDGDTIHYTAYIDEHRESGLGTYDATAGVLVRTTVYDSTNGGAKVSFPAGTKILECAPVASRMLTLDGPTKTRFKANKANVDQPLTTGGMKVTFANEVFDEGGIFDHVNSRFIPAAGKTYLVYGQGTLVVASGQRNLEMRLLKNGSTGALGYDNGENGMIAGPTFFDMITGNGTDYYEVQAFMATISSGTYSIRGLVTETYFMACEL